MGVPKFYRWISERYPCLSEIVKENQIPEFDNLYLDMNGIIHTCSHPNDEDPHFRITEEQIFRDIFRYIEVLFRIIHPRKVFFMAVDGVAPRAKMNQQRGRRFMSARTAEELIAQAVKKGEKLPTEERFDSNCITPGTVFMARLHEQLKYFVNMKITTDDMWRGIRIYLSGHDVPGEGEHKIMDFIRYERSQPGYDCNTRHCLYGLDADLIMLGLSSHEPYFALLREEVKFGRPTKKNTQRSSNAEQTTFHLLHLSLLRDYIELEFGGAKENLPFEFDLESIIDDWVLMGFLVGNDFLPHLPNLHIHSNALPTLYKAYKKAMPDLGGYINEKGFLNLPRFEKFMATLVQFDRDFFEEEYADLQWLETKSSFPSRDIRKNVQRKIYPPEPRELVPYTDSDSENVGSSNYEEVTPSAAGISEQGKERSPSTESDDISNMPDELQDLIRRSNVNCKNSDTSGDDDDADVKPDVSSKSEKVVVDYYEDMDSDSWSPTMEKKFKEFKTDYYKSKMKYLQITPEVLHEQAVQYVRAIQWNLNYYYNGISSWSWYYPFHYAPYLSDVRGFSNLDIKFELGEPFFPFQQLLAVLPAASRKLLPTAYQALMTESDSPLIDFYPSKFETDLNGKKNDWEAVILIPFIEEGRLLRAMTPRTASLTDEEKERNRQGKHLLYTTAAQDQGFYRTPLMGVFPDLEHNKAICKELDAAMFRLPPSKIRKGLLPGIRLDMYFLGFSTLKHLPHVGELTSRGVKVFEQPSKGESMIIKLLDDGRNNQEIPELAKALLGKQVYVNWPHLTVGLVNSLVVADARYLKADGNNDVQRVGLHTKDMRAFGEYAEELQTKYATTRAVDIGEVKVVVNVNRLLGKKYVCNQQGEISLDRQWGDVASQFALQTVVQNVNVRDSVSDGKYSSIDDMYPVGSKVFLVSNPFYGCEGIVKNSFDQTEHRFRVEVTVRAEPDFSRLIASKERIGLFWYPGWQASKSLNVSGQFLGRITGTVYVTENGSSSSGSNSSSGNRFNIGLNLKFSKKNEEVPDYTKRDQDGVWLYSSKVLKILDEYIQKFPEVCDFLHSNDGGRDLFSAEDFWKPNVCKQKLSELVEWLKALPCHGLQHQTAGTETIDERVIRVMETTVEKNKALHKKETKLVKVRPNALFRACLSEGHASPDSRADFRLLDRVVCAREGYTVPIGLRGTVVGIHPGRQEGDMKLSVIFDDDFIGGISIRNGKCNGYHIMASALVNLSYGNRLRDEKNKEKQSAVATHQQQQQPSSFQLHGHYVSERRDDRKPLRQAPHRLPVALQNAPPQSPATYAAVSKSGQSAFKIAQRPAAGPPEQQTSRPVLHKSMSESHKTSYSKALQGGKSIMNEIFPNRAIQEEAGSSKSGEIVIVNSNLKKEKDIEESSRALRSLLQVGVSKEPESKKRSDAKGRNSKTPRDDHHQQYGHQQSQSPPKTGQEGPRVPFTARRPQTPPFAPTFDSPVAPVPPAPPSQPLMQQQQPSFQLGHPPMISAAIPSQHQAMPAPIPIAHIFQQQPAPPSQNGQYQLQGMRPPSMPGQIVAPSHQMQPSQQQMLNFAHPPPPLLAPAPRLPFSPIVLPNQGGMTMGQTQQPINIHQLQQLQQQQMQHHLDKLQQQQRQNMQLQQMYRQQLLQHGHGPPPQHHQQQQQQHQQQFRENNHQGRQRRISNSAKAGGHEQFVPMQVTKKQPAPAYVKNITAAAGTEKAPEVSATENQRPSNPGQQTSAVVGNASGNNGYGTSAGEPKQRRQQPNSGTQSTRPKSRLAIKLAPAPPN